MAAAPRLRTPDLVELGVGSLSTRPRCDSRRPGVSGKPQCPRCAYILLNERRCEMLRRLVRGLLPATTTVTIGRGEEWVSSFSLTSRSSGATSGVRRLISALPSGFRRARPSVIRRRLGGRSSGRILLCAERREARNGSANRKSRRGRHGCRHECPRYAGQPRALLLTLTPMGHARPPRGQIGQFPGFPRLCPKAPFPLCARD